MNSSDYREKAVDHRLSIDDDSSSHTIQPTTDHRHRHSLLNRVSNK